jgi:hypothetical protein
MTYQEHVRDFELHARLRAELVEHWPSGGRLDPALVRSLQRFQAGEDGDGASLISKSARAGDQNYLAAVRLFVAEEQNHARLLKNILTYGGESIIDGHWTDTVFVAVRRALGLRLELMTLMLAEVVALRYYRALRDGTRDALVTDVAGRILADEQRHVPFHVDRLRDGFADTPVAARLIAAGFWWVLMTGATLVVAVDHGRALHVLGVSRRRFVREVLALFRPIVREVFFAAAAGKRRPPAQFVDAGNGAAAGKSEPPAQLVDSGNGATAADSSEPPAQLVDSGSGATVAGSGEPPAQFVGAGSANGLGPGRNGR